MRSLGERPCRRIPRVVGSGEREPPTKGGPPIGPGGVLLAAWASGLLPRVVDAVERVTARAGRRRRAPRGRGHRGRQGRPLRRGDVVRASTRPRCSPWRRPAWSTSTTATATPSGSASSTSRTPTSSRDLAREPVAGGDAARGHQRPADAQRPLPRLPPAPGLRRRAAGGVPHRRQARGAWPALFREPGRAPFDADDVAVLDAISPIVGGRLPHPGGADGADARASRTHPG